MTLEEELATARARIAELESAAHEMCATLGTEAHITHVALYKRLSLALDKLRGALLPAPVVEVCNHGITFDEEAAKGLSASEVKKRWPRLSATCPKGCGYNGIYYASYMHYLSGDW